MTKQEINETVAQLERLISVADKYAHCWFWKPACNAAGRRQEERNNTVDYFTWEDDGHVYSGEFDVTCSCKNIYAKGRYTKDGKKTTLLAVKNSYKRIKALQGQEEVVTV